MLYCAQVALRKKEEVFDGACLPFGQGAQLADGKEPPERTGKSLHNSNELTIYNLEQRRHISLGPCDLCFDTPGKTSQNGYFQLLQFLVWRVRIRRCT